MAQGTSEFVITGRGGLPPNPTEVTRSDLVLADLGTPIIYKSEGKGDLGGSPDLVKPDRVSKGVSINATNSESTTVVKAVGWVIGSKGEVILTATALSVTPDIPWLKPTSCNGS